MPLFKHTSVDGIEVTGLWVHKSGGSILIEMSNCPWGGEDSCSMKLSKAKTKELINALAEGTSQIMFWEE